MVESKLPPRGGASLDVGISRNLVVENKLPPRGGSSLDAVEPHP